jgi:hypothetical protein
MFITLSDKYIVQIIFPELVEKRHQEQLDYPYS